MQILRKIIGKFAPKLIAEIGKNSSIPGRIECRHPASTVRVGEDCVMTGTLVVETETSCISIGNNVFIGSGSILDCLDQIHVGDDVLISYDVLIMDSDNHSTRASVRAGDLKRWRNQQYDWSHVSRSPVRIGPKAWIGARAIITKGVEIGEGAIVASGAVVSKNVPPYTIVAGNPAETVRVLNADER